MKKRAEQTKVDSDSEINWDEDDDDLENVQDIPGNNLKHQMINVDQTTVIV